MNVRTISSQRSNSFKDSGGQNAKKHHLVVFNYRFVVRLYECGAVRRYCCRSAGLWGWRRLLAWVYCPTPKCNSLWQFWLFNNKRKQEKRGVICRLNNSGWRYFFCLQLELWYTLCKAIKTSNTRLKEIWNCLSVSLSIFFLTARP